jgi:hypothetical protein
MIWVKPPLLSLVSASLQNLLSKHKVHIWFSTGKYFCKPIIEKLVDPSVRKDGSTIRRAKTACPVQDHLKDPLQFPHKKQYLLKVRGPGVSCLS